MPELENISKSIRARLDQEGHAFQYAVIEAARAALTEAGSSWFLEATEFPVVSNRHESRIDIILRLGDHPVFLTIECKRVNRRYSHWCFAKSPYVRKGGRGDRLIYEYYGTDEDNGRKYSIGRTGRYIDEEAYHVPVVLKGTGEDRPDDKGRRAIDNAAFQACAGAQGLIAHWHRVWSDGYAGGSPYRIVLPVIVTSGEIYTTDVDLSKASLSDGKIGEADVESSEKDWVIYQYHMSPSLRLRAEDPVPLETTQVSHNLAALFIRSVPIVRASALVRFLQWLEPDRFNPIEDIESATGPE